MMDGYKLCHCIYCGKELNRAKWLKNPSCLDCKTKNGNIRRIMKKFGIGLEETKKMLDKKICFKCGKKLEHYKGEEYSYVCDCSPRIIISIG